jgi:peptide/nickel transport system permease protein
MSMLYYFLRRLLYMLVLVVALSVIVFAIIQLPPGDYAQTYILRMEMQGGENIEEQIAAIKRQFGLDLPIHRQYLRWVSGLARGYLGRSFVWNRPINELLAERLPLTIITSLSSMLFTYAVAIPIGVYSATHQYSAVDHVATIIGFIGVSLPGFLFAMFMLVFLYETFDISAVGLFSREYAQAPWSWGRVRDLLNHLWTPVIVIGLSGTCGLIRVMRATLLDELSKPYVQTARAKGLNERRLLLKYPFRVAINPILSTIGWSLRGIFSGSTIVATVLLLPTVGPLLLNALRVEDFYVAGSILMIMTILTLIGTFISDILLAWADPRVRFE